ncbi:MAG: histidine phosphatase family protein, partial [Roseimicrobium sp.]
ILQMPELREPQVGAFRTGNLKLPFPVWKWMLRLAWMSSHSSQRNAKTAFMTKVRHIADEILSKAQEDTLIVSHAGVMMFLRKELVKMGYTGPGFKIAENGKLYVFERGR